MPGGVPSARLRRKELARALVARWDLAALARWAAGEPQAIPVLQGLLFDPDDLVAWRAVEALGCAAGALARGGLEPARELVRRTLWLMNDESGGLLWHGPQVLGAVLARVSPLAGELGPVLASFLEEEPFRAGTRWGLWRLAPVAPAVVREVAPALRASLGDAAPAVRGLAALALRGAGLPIPEVAADRAPFTLFDFRTGELREATVSAAAEAP